MLKISKNLQKHRKIYSIQSVIFDVRKRNFKFAQIECELQRPEMHFHEEFFCNNETAFLKSILASIAGLDELSC